MTTAAEPRVLQELEGAPWEIQAYRKVGGYEAWEKCVKELSANDIVNELKKAGLRGRGGAGFPTGIKWEKVLNHRVKDHYFVCNAGEHEPGTFKDRYLLKQAPHQLIEGCLIAAYTVQAKAAFIYVNHEYHEERENLKKALAQAKAHGFLGANILGTGVNLDLEILRPRELRSRRRDRNVGIHARASGDAQTEAAFLPDGLRPLREADAGQQCRNLVQHSADPPERCRLVYAGRHREVPGHDDVLPERCRE